MIGAGKAIAGTMKIDPTGLTGTTGIRRRDKTRKKSADRFGGHLESEVSGSAHAGATMGTAGVQGLLALQEVGGVDADARRAVARGKDLLDRMDDIRQDLLTGAPTREKLQDLAATVRSVRARAHEPRLEKILDDVELRARVELAKYQR